MVFALPSAPCCATAINSSAGFLTFCPNVEFWGRQAGVEGSGATFCREAGIAKGLDEAALVMSGVRA